MDNKQNPHKSIQHQDNNYKVAETFNNSYTISIKSPDMGFRNTMLMPYSLITHYHDNKRNTG